MKFKLVFALFFIIGNLFSQAKFEKGYYLTMEGNKVDCLIKNEDWINIPSSIDYKIHENSKVNTIHKKSLKKVFINQKIHLEKHLVKVNRYNGDLNNLDKSRTSKFEEEELLLKVLVEGKANLYKYNSGGVDYFFYKKKDSKILPLEFKLYKTKKNTLGKNLNYQKTLREELDCNDTNLKSNITYNEKNLVDYFTKYNSCHNSLKTVYSQTSKKGKLNIYAKFSIGISKSSNSFSASLNSYFDPKIAYKIGTEIEYVFPFNNNKWSLFTEPTYQSYNDEKTFLTGYKEVVVPSSGTIVNQPIYTEGKIEYNSIELPIGGRHYFF
ncbi:hypothetical protein P8625_00155 [Tenacibaculum tangerinum]|uniref:tRNA modification GTPase n=1 Tax=Tenacibaculum tangerinum TaxID=3038772 RepID=A0ABY8L2F0_9FLAO|nr:hypothetical protein [Tenacibaculum tangerinum]WGH75609.1 hypothetical protein P8625_00155 [Tenacibaculum tangerinum]